MLKLIVAAILALACAACSQLQAKVDKDIQTITLPDLQTALADATAANHAGGITCWGGLIAYVNALPTPAAGSSAPALGGAATALELGSELANAPQVPLQLPPLPAPVHDACAGILLDDANLLAKLGITVGALGKIKIP
jgi:hypothetical protein